MPERRIIITGAHVATVNAAGAEFAGGTVVVEDHWITSVGPGPAPGYDDGVPTEYVDGTGHLLTPGLVNTHHHLYQWLTRGRAQEQDLFGWLTELYPVWARIDEELVHAAARASIAALLTSGCSTAADHQYVFPAGSGDLIGAAVRAAGELGLRFQAARGSMDLGESRGGLPPDFAVEDTGAALAGTEQAIDAYHDPAPDAMVRVSVAPCSPFTVTGELLDGAAALARRRGVRLHTHTAETAGEVQQTREQFGRTPAEFLDGHGWLGGDVWLAHCVHLDPAAIERFGATGTGVAHCPSSNARLGAGIAPVPELLAAGVPVGLGVDGSSSNETGQLGPEIRQAVLVARARRGAAALTARQGLHAATAGGARCLGRDGELGSIEPGKLADLALWRIDGPLHSTIADPVAALALGALPPLTLLLVQGRATVTADQLVTADAGAIARQAATAARRLAERAGLR
ncbi:MAG TPA: 8-oxoguanine deaminase [Streptosporangiaceae bacterium]|nr:8-oxoguanine deaminase [Streptosporangiaceae bacterium]